MRFSVSALLGWLVFIPLAFSEGGLLAEPSRMQADETGSTDTAKADEAPIRLWTCKLVDGTTKKPLPGIDVSVMVDVAGVQGQQVQILESDDSGLIKIPLRKGKCTSVNVHEPGWCQGSGTPVVGELPAEYTKLLTIVLSPPDPNRIRTVEFYRGTEVRGRLLLPDGNPAAGARVMASARCNRSPWISRAAMDRAMMSTDSLRDMPPWQTGTITKDDGSFSLTVPPPNVRGGIRIGTAPSRSHAIETDSLEATNKEHVLVRFAPFELEVNGEPSSRQVDESTGVLELGELQLSSGIALHGRVIDAQGQPLAGIQLLTSGARGPYAGRKTVSRTDGTFEFMPMNAGTFRLSPIATLRDADGNANSRDVQAVFVAQEVTLSGASDSHELVVQALPHVELEFEWVDRRKDKSSVSYHGGFTLTGHVPRTDGSKAWWHGETVRVTRGSRELLVVKVPATVLDLNMGLHADERVTPSYHDDSHDGATGQILLGDPAMHMRRVIYADEPKRAGKD